MGTSVSSRASHLTWRVSRIDISPPWGMPNRRWVEARHLTHFHGGQQKPQGHQSRWPVTIVTPGEKDGERRESWDLHSHVPAVSGMCPVCTIIHSVRDPPGPFCQPSARSVPPGGALPPPGFCVSVHSRRG